MHRFYEIFSDRVDLGGLLFWWWEELVFERIEIFFVVGGRYRGGDFFFKVKG